MNNKIIVLLISFFLIICSSEVKAVENIDLDNFNYYFHWGSPQRIECYYL